MNLKIIFIFTMISIVLAHCGPAFHTHLTEKELNLLFDHDSNSMLYVDYKIVPIAIESNHSIKKRENVDEELHLEVFNKTYTLYLEETDHVLFGETTPMFIARLDKNDSEPKVIYERKKYPVLRNYIKYYHDRSKRSDISVHCDDEDMLHINGKVDHCLLIRSIPNNIKSKLEKENSDLLIQKNDHIVMKRNNCTNVKDESDLDKDLKGRSLNLKNKFETEISESNNLSIVYPEVLVVVHHEIYEEHNRDLTSLATYMTAFWNGVDLRFRELNNPKVRLNIAGLVVNTHKDVQTYFKPFLTSSNGSLIGNDNILEDVGEQFCDTNKQNSTILGPKSEVCYADIIVFMTPKYFLHGNRLESGLASYDGACYGESSVAIVTDLGDFTGILTAAHELGHLFGALHDGEETTEVCLNRDGYLMSTTFGTKNIIHWSQCSATTMHSFLQSEQANCLKNEPNVGIPGSKKLPGKLLTRDQQCNIIYPGSHGIDEDCLHLMCEVHVSDSNEDNQKKTGSPPAEGTSCGEKRICLNGTCVGDPEYGPI